MIRFALRLLAVAALSLVPLSGAWAQIRIGAIVAVTGPSAAQGIGYRNAFELFPTEWDGQKITYIVRDDESNPNNAVSIAQKMLAEDHIDAMIGPSLTASAAAVRPILEAAKVPMVITSPVDPDPVKYPFGFTAVQSVPLMVAALVDEMQRRGVKTVGFIGFSDGFGDQVFQALQKTAPAAGIEIVGDERYARTDPSAEAQALRVISRRPDAVLLGGAGTPAALPVVALRRRGYKGAIYGNHGIVSPAFLRIGGEAVDGTIAVTGPVLVYDQLPASNPSKAEATAFMEAYAKKFGAENLNGFAGYSYDAMLILRAATPAALAAGAPGTEAFRVALREAIQRTHELVGVHGVYSMSPTDHNGMDARARVLVVAEKGTWRLLP